MVLKKVIYPELIIFLSAFALYSFLPAFAPPGVWNSPDETANAFFIERLAKGDGLAFFDPAVVLSGGFIHPRSVAVSGGLLAPGSFLGMIIFYSLPAAILGIRVLPFITPFLSALALLPLFAVFKKIISYRAALISVILSAAHPAIWYYSNRGLFHNIFFLDALIFALFFFICQPFGSRSAAKGAPERLGAAADGLLGGAALSLAIAARTFEALWVLPLFLFLAWRYRLSARRELLLGAVLTILFFGALFAILGKIIYGNWLPSGYGSAGAPIYLKLQSALAPFKFSWSNIVFNGQHYGLKIFWWWSVPAIVAGVWLLVLRMRASAPPRLWIFFKIYLAISAPLILIYGSGRYLDTPDPNTATIGISTIRYWLPFYLWSVPLVGWLLDEKLKGAKAGRFLTAVIVLSFVFFSGRAVFFGPGEGLVSIRRELQRYAGVREAVLKETPREAIILSDRSDKIFFPHRRVVARTNSEVIIESLPLLATIGPLYLYAINLAPDDPRRGSYAEAGFSLEEKLQFGKERLYAIRRTK